MAAFGDEASTTGGASRGAGAGFSMSQMDTIPRSDSEPAWRVLLVLGAVGVGIYAAQAIATGFMARLPDLFFSASDAREYRDVSRWLYGLVERSSSSERRPILYPAFLGIVQVGGIHAAWIAQAAMWLGAALLTTLAVRRATSSWRWATVAFALFVAHPTLVAHTFHGLTETLVVLLWSTWLYVASAGGLLSEPRQIGRATFLLSLLTITKPIYKLHLLVFLAAVVVAALREQRAVGGRVLHATLGLVPVGMQIAVMLAVHGTVGVSAMDGMVMRCCFVPSVYRHVHHVTLDDALVATRALSATAFDSFVVEHPEAAAYAFWKNLDRENLSAGCGFLRGVSWTQAFFIWSRIYNTIAYGLHFAFVFVVARYLWRRRDVSVLLAYTYAAMIVASTGLVFWAGDRLIAMAWPLWFYVWTVVAHDLTVASPWGAARAERRSLPTARES